MTLGEVEVALKKLTGNQVVQGELLGRLERVTAENTEAIADLTKVVAHNTRAIANLTEVANRHSESITRLTDGLQLMQDAMHRLFEQIDRFIRGLGGDGRRGP